MPRSFTLSEELVITIELVGDKTIVPSFGL